MGKQVYTHSKNQTWTWMLPISSHITGDPRISTLDSNVCISGQNDERSHTKLKCRMVQTAGCSIDSLQMLSLLSMYTPRLILALLSYQYTNKLWWRQGWVRVLWNVISHRIQMTILKIKQWTFLDTFWGTAAAWTFQLDSTPYNIFFSSTTKCQSRCILLLE